MSRGRDTAFREDWARGSAAQAACASPRRLCKGLLLRCTRVEGPDFHLLLPGPCICSGSNMAHEQAATSGIHWSSLALPLPRQANGAIPNPVLVRGFRKLYLFGVAAHTVWGVIKACCSPFLCQPSLFQCNNKSTPIAVYHAFPIVALRVCHIPYHLCAAPAGCNSHWAPGLLC